MAQDFAMVGFDTVTIQTKFPSSLSNMNLFRYGKDKLERLCSFYLGYIKRLNEKEGKEEIEDEVEHINGMLEVFSKEPFFYDYSTYIFLRALDDHMTEFGDINFEELDFNADWT